MKKILIPFYILGKSVYTFKNILEQKREGWRRIPKIARNLFALIYMLFIEKLVFTEPSMDIISNYQDFCQWYLKVYSLGIILLGFWILEPLFLKEKDFNEIKITLFWGFVGLIAPKII
jgi:hypothetical protein